MATPVSGAVARTGDTLIDALIQGAQWQFTGARVLTYSLSLNDTSSGGTWSLALANAVRLAFAEWSNVANVSFAESGSGTQFTSSTADIAVTLTGNELQDVDAAALAIFPSPEFVDAFFADTEYDRSAYPRPEGDVFLDNYYEGYNYLQRGELGFYLIMHEIGHALGLKHPSDDGANGRPTFDELGIGSLETPDHTIMSVENPGSTVWAYVPSTPRPLDILAIQHLYGANTTFASGNDNYEVVGLKTIWDTGGIDTLTGPGGAGPFTMDLRPGGFSTGSGTRVAIAYGVTIENAVGSAYSDTIYGNGVANRIDGHWGADRLYGGAGDDSYSVDAMGDEVFENPGEGSDAVTSAVSFTLGPNVEHLTLVGGQPAGGTGNALDNTLLGNSQANVLDAQGGNDLLDGGGGRDTMYGGPGDDFYMVANGAPSSLPTVLYMLGQPGTYVLDSERVLLPDDGQFRFQVDDSDNDRQINGLQIFYSSSAFGGPWWHLSFRAAGGEELRATSYTNTLEYASMDRPGLYLGGEGRSTTPVEGAFTISAFDYAYVNSGFEITRLAVQFEQNYGTRGHVQGYFNFNHPGSLVVPDTVVEFANQGDDTVRSSVSYALPDHVENLVLAGSGALDATGNSLSNLLVGNELNNVLNGAGGHDTLRGGHGRDTALFAGPRYAYSIARGAGEVTVTGPEGTDTLTGIERLRFSDLLIPVHGSPFADFNADGNSDLLLRHAGGALKVHTLGGAGSIAEATWAYPAAWRVAQTQGDFNGDGRSDLLLRHDEGYLEIRQMSGAGYSAEANWRYPASWKVAGAQGDFNGDGNSDLLLRNDDGTLEIRLMQGIGYSAEVDWRYPSTWNVASSQSDFNGDSHSDLLLRNDSGMLEIRLMNGVGYLGEVDWMYPASWKVASAQSDFNGDGRSDLLLRNDNGTLEVRLMDGVRYSAEVDWRYPSSWQVVTAQADFNADGKSDLLLRNDGGALEIRLMDGIRYSAETTWMYPSSWKVASAGGDFNGDGRTDLLLRNDSGLLEIRLMNGVGVAAEAQLGYAPEWKVLSAAEDINGDTRSDVLLHNEVTGAFRFLQMDGAGVMGSIDLLSPPGWSVVS